MAARTLPLLPLAFVITLLNHATEAINCYTCSSMNGSDSYCEDPFHPALALYNQKCMVPKTGHIGLFPANFCIKIIGTNVETSELMVIRACVMKTMDSQCGAFRYQDLTMKGCILTCDFDGCNSAGLAEPAWIPLALVLMVVIARIYAQYGWLRRVQDRAQNPRRVKAE